MPQTLCKTLAWSMRSCKHTSWCEHETHQGICRGRVHWSKTLPISSWKLTIFVYCNKTRHHVCCKQRSKVFCQSNKTTLDCCEAYLPEHWITVSYSARKDLLSVSVFLMLTGVVILMTESQPLGNHSNSAELQSVGEVRSKQVSPYQLQRPNILL